MISEAIPLYSFNKIISSAENGFLAMTEILIFYILPAINSLSSAEKLLPNSCSM